MRTIPPEYGFFLLLVAGITVLLLPASLSLPWVVALLLAVLTGITLYLTRRSPDRAFYLTCAGQPAAVACGIISIWAGLFVEMMLAGMVAGTMGLLVSREDYQYLLLFFCLSSLLALVVWFSNHVFPLMLAFAAALALLALVVMIRGYQFRKECTGAPP